MERLGLLGVTTPEADEVAERRISDLATLLTLVLMSKYRASDSYARLVRGRSMRVGAEMLWT